MVGNVDLVKTQDAQRECAWHQAIIGERVIDIRSMGDFEDHTR